MLIPFLPFDSNESPLSYTARLARYHANKPMLPFLHDMRIKPEKLASGEFDALSRLGEISGTPVDDLCRNVPVSKGERTYDLRGELIKAEFLASPFTVFCPACLAEDDQIGLRRGRWEWSLSVVRTCPHHEIPLLRQAKVAWDDMLHELDRRVPERGEKLDAMALKALHRSVSPLQDYVVRRLDGKAGPKWLDAQTLDQATRASELLGVLIAFGPVQKLPELSVDDWDHAGRVGFAVTAGGEPAIREALEAQFRTFDDATGTPGARKIFGVFYNALSNSKSHKEPGDIARILREVITGRIALPVGSKVLGVKLAERKLHTVASLAEEQGLNSQTLRNVLVAADLIPEGARSHFAIPVEKGREVAQRMKRIVHVISLPEELNCKRPLVDDFFADRMLTPIYYGRPGVRGRTQKAVDREEIAMLVGKLHAQAVIVGAVDDTVVPVSKAAEKAKVPAIIVVHMILGGFLERVERLADQEGIGALRVDPAEIKQHAPIFATTLSSAETFSALKITKEMMWSLVDRCPEEVSLGINCLFGPNSSHQIPRFDPVAVDEFKAKFIHPARMAEQHDLPFGEVVGRLRRRGVRPVLSKAEIGVDFYRISALKSDIFI